MKQLALFGTFLLLVVTSFGASLDEVKKVYLLSMSNGMDQYLAVKLTQSGAVQVVTDPIAADAVLTDQVGPNFEEKMKALYAPKKSESGKADDKEGNPTFVRVQSVSRIRGNAFLISRKTGDVLWSTAVRPKDTTPNEIKRTSDKIADELAKAFKGK